MNIELTESQLKTLDAEGSHARVVDPRTNAGYILVPIQEFESIRDILEDEKQEVTIHRIALRNAAARIEDEK